jgi:hypothetical protein
LRFQRHLDGQIDMRARMVLALCVIPLALAILLPLWQIHMVAPQYPEGLDLNIWTWKVEGGEAHHIEEINTLNHYIGMSAIDEALLADLDWIPFTIGLLAILVLRVAVIGNLRMLVDLAVIASYLSGFLMWRFWWHLYQLGHDLDPEAPVNVEPFMPAYLGTKKIANFTVTSLPRIGAYAMMLAVGGILLVTLLLLWKGRREALRADRAHATPSA